MPESTAAYPFTVRWIEGRRAVGSAPEIPGVLDLAPPAEFGGPGGIWTPEHLFVGAATTCWLTTFLAVAELSKLELAAVEAHGEGVVERQEDRRFAIPRITLRPRVTVVHERDRERALRLVEKAENACLVSRSMKTRIALEPVVEVAEPTPVDGVEEPVAAI